MESDSLDTLEASLGYRFRNRTYLQCALAHRSYRFENNDVEYDNERLEFLGDAVLGFLAASYLFQARADYDEGTLTSCRSRATSGKTLSMLAREIDIGDFMLMGAGEERSGGRRRQSNLANALEALIGAVYIDGGIDACRQLFENLFVPMIAGFADDVWADNPKGRLQEYCQSRWKLAPDYRIIEQVGPPHDTVFTVRVILPDGAECTATGKSKQAAESSAAHAILEQIGPGKTSPQ